MINLFHFSSLIQNCKSFCRSNRKPAIRQWQRTIHRHTRQSIRSSVHRDCSVCLIFHNAIFSIGRYPQCTRIVCSDMPYTNILQKFCQIIDFLLFLCIVDIKSIIRCNVFLPTIFIYSIYHALSHATCHIVIREFAFRQKQQSKTRRCNPIISLVILNHIGDIRINLAVIDAYKI